MATHNIEDISGEAKAKCYKKLKDVDLDCCPYQLPSDTWNNDPMKWPDLEFPDIYVYLIKTPGAFTKESMKNRKSLEAYNQFISSWVRTAYHYQKLGSNFITLKAEVIISLRLNEKPHLPWVAINLRGTSVETAHRPCIAGLGESCSHIGALLFKLEATVRTGFTKTACTVVACAWNQDFVKKIKSDKIANIKIYSQKAIDNSKKREPKTVFSGTNVKPKNENIDLFLS